MKPFDLLNNRPQSALKLTNNGSQSGKEQGNSAKVNPKTIKSATKNPAPAPTGGGSFKGFIKQ